MYRWFRRRRMALSGLVFAAIVISMSSPLRAHLTGAFSTYLAAVYNEDTTQQLKDELARTRAEIAALTPRLERMEESFAADRSAAGWRLLEWTYAGLDLWANFAQAAATMTDSLANQWLIERELSRELGRLEQLYTQYLQLGATRDALAGHEDLLGMIQENLAMRAPYLASMGDIDLETQAYYLDMDWVAEVEEELIEALQADRTLVASQWEQWLSVSEFDGSLMFSENWLNERSSIRYHFRPDHLYAVFENEFAHVILVAQVLRNDDQMYEFVIEGAFFNGFMVPEPALEELEGFTLSHSSLTEKTAAPSSAYLEQASGRLVWRMEDGT